MYGTRRPAEGWQDMYSSTLLSLGFTQGVASPCVFAHKERGLVVSVHADAFTAAGAKNQLDWFEKSMRERCELTIRGGLGPGLLGDKEALIFNLVVRWLDDLEYCTRQTQGRLRISWTSLIWHVNG